MKFQIITIVSLFSLINCIKVEEKCKYVNPLEESIWLKEMHTSFEADSTVQKIIEYYFNGETVFYVDYCYQCPDAISYVFDCNKNTLCEFGGIDGRNTCSNFVNATNKKILYYK